MLEKEELSQRKHALERERAQLQSLLAQAQEIQQQNHIQVVQDFADFSQRMLSVLENPTEEVKREVIRLLVDHIIVDEDAIICNSLNYLTSLSTILCLSTKMSD